MSKFKASRPAAVAGMFYPDDPVELQEQVNHYLYEEPSPSTQVPKAIIVPHAGYIYSGSVAAAAYRSIMQYRHVIRKVILLGPAHRVPLSGLAVPTVDEFETPLGNIKLDTKTISSLVNDLSQLTFSDLAHADEHSLEVQLPFLQSTLASFRLIPFVVGNATEIEVADIIEKLWGGDECLIVISSDLSHFHNYDKAVRLDGETATAIETLKGDSLPEQSACGRIPISGLLQVARQRKM
ncbi:MAG: AmmeMemoRadiSam system protein B, partial [Candidatus Marinimicrobia bacterium]|nr:AmmeMemoRadiSam system protein B [Candidatus Neomarinimicrobiota bacterium]